MARRSSSVPPEDRSLSVSEMHNGIDRLKRRIEELKTFDPESVTMRRSSEVVSLETAIEDTLAAIFGQGTPKFKRYRFACDLEPPPNVDFTPDWIAVRGGGSGQSGENLHELRHGIADRKRQAVALLEQAVRGLEEEIPQSSPGEGGTQVWHRGRDRDGRGFSMLALQIQPQVLVAVKSLSFMVTTTVRRMVARFIEKLGFDPIILHERPNKGRAIIAKFREEADGVDFAVVLLTPDDLGKAKEGVDLKLRARQNVVLELGFFVGALGPERVAPLVKGEIDLPSDYDGVVLYFDG